MLSFKRSADKIPFWLRPGLPVWGAAALLVVALVAGGCPTVPTAPIDGDGNDATPSAQAADCLGCHTNETLLKEVARDEDPAPADTGEG